MRKSVLTFFILPVCLLPHLSPAQLLRVDINTGIGRSDTTAPGFRRWDLTGTYVANSANRLAMQSFTNITYSDDVTNDITLTNISIITCVVAETFPANVDSTIFLNANSLNKNGAVTGGDNDPDPSHGWRLSYDGMWVHQKDNNPTTVDRPYTNGGAFSLTISNLPAGPHTITTYHNDIWGTNASSWLVPSNSQMSKCVVSANGVPVYTNTPSFQVTNDARCGYAFFTITNNYDGQPVVINFDPDHSGPLDFVILNGFEIDRSTAPGSIASGSFPANGNEHVFASNDNPTNNSAGKGFLTLTWVPALAAISNEVYFGTNSNAVVSATHASAEFKGIIGTNANALNVTNLDSKLTYYWRVDSLNVVTNGVTNLDKGDVWYFRTRHQGFPGAEGYGRWARGGRGGVVMEVTNLLDYNANEPVIPGSYRAAIEATGPRTVVFRVSGFIPLKRPCTVNNANGYLTVAGQTAPGDGICLGNYRAGFGSCNDVIMRFVRLRVGDFCRQAMDGIGNGNSDYTIIDHCSLSWAIDEQTSSRSGHNFSFQNNIISEALNDSYHYNDALRASTGCTNCYQPHSFAGSISGGVGSYHHNLLAHNTGRNWSLAGGLTGPGKYDGYIDIRNNVIYNWTTRTTDGGAKAVNFIGNYYKPGPESTQTHLMSPDCGGPTDRQQYYVTNNVFQGQSSYYPNNWNGVSPQPASSDTGFNVSQIQTNTPFFPDLSTNGAVTTQSATNAYKIVLSDCGATLPRQDSIDMRAITNTLQGGWTVRGSKDNLRGIIDSQDDVGGYPTNLYATYNVPADTDHDGLPDWWELIKGTNPNSPPGDFSDANADPDGDGYSNLEDYLNWLAAPHFECVTNAIVDVDLIQFTRGFTNTTPTYTISNPTNGTVALLAGGTTARFTNNLSTNGLGSFKFVVTDLQGSSMTNIIGVHIMVPNHAPVLTPVSDRVINPGVTLLLTNTATDSDVPANLLAFSLPVAPTNATLVSSNGIFTWRPLVTQANTTNPIMVVVTDNGTPGLSATQNFSVIVNPLTPPNITSPGIIGGQLGLSVNGQVGPDYAVQTSTNLTDWNTLFTTNPAAMPFSWAATNLSALPMQFYRIKVGPPLP